MLKYIDIKDTKMFIVRDEYKKEVFKIDRRCNDLKKIIEAYPSLIIEDSSNVYGNQLFYKDSKYVDENGREYVSPEEWLEASDDED